MGSVSAVLVNSLHISSNTQKDLRMKAVVLGLIAFVGSCHSAGIPVVAKVGHGMAAVTPPIGAAGGFKSSGVFAGPFFAENLDYSICINPEVEFAKGITLRANIFKMPVGGKDIVCASGHEIVNKKTAVDCCLAPQSGYIGITAWQPYSRDWKKRALRRYWCGLELGTDNQITTEDFIFRVVTGEDYKCKFDPIGFDIEYKVDTGM